MESDNSLNLILQRSHHNYLQLGQCSQKQKNQGIRAIATGLEQSLDAILDANTLDLLEAREMVMPDLIVNWLKLTPERLKATVKLLEAISNLNDPLSRQLYPSHQYYNRSQSYCQAMPLGVIAFIFEGFPELAAIASAMAIKTGNSIILRGMGESSHSVKVIIEVIKKALEETNLPIHAIERLSSDEGSSLQELVSRDDYLQLVIPYGRFSLIRKVKEMAAVPTITSVMGNCYLYYANSGDADLAYRIIVDSHQSQPDAVNAIEKVIVEANYKPFVLVKLWKNLQQQGFSLGGDVELVKEFPEYLAPVSPEDWAQPYLKPFIAFRKVENIQQGVAFINQHSSGHADTLVTDSYADSMYFAREIDSIFTYINSSPAFSRLSDNRESVYLGIANQKDGHRGLIGLETLTTFKQVIC